MQLTLSLLLCGLVLLALAFGDRAIRILPLTPALLYLVVGWLAGAVLGAPALSEVQLQAGELTVVLELALLISLFAVGLRLQLPPTLRRWRHALVLAGPTMVACIGLGAAAAVLLLGLAWPLALLVAAVHAPTDPILASEVQIESDDDRDQVRLALTAEGGLNDGTALPAVMAALGLMGLHGLSQWWWRDLLWPIFGGAVIGLLLGALLGLAVRRRLRAGDRLWRDELLYIGAVVLCYGVARASATSAFVVAFVAAATMLVPAQLAAGEKEQASADLAARLHAFGASIERLVEAVLVMAVGVALHAVRFDGAVIALALLLLVAVRPLSVLIVGPRQGLTPHQRRLVSWFGIRGIGSLFYLTFALEHGVSGEAAHTLVAVTLATIALSIVLHGVSATPLMAAYRRRRQPR
jgi:NhaP-type Na+/H+ or K+/H+ antiporter